MKVRILLVNLLFLATTEFAHGVEIECTYVDGDWNAFGYFYTCSGTIVSVENPSTVTRIGGHHTGGRNNEDVKGFAIAGDRTLISIPQGIAEFFPNLEALEWINGDIRTIDSSIFEPLLNLLHINLATNNIVELPAFVKASSDLLLQQFNLSCRTRPSDWLDRLDICKFPFESVH